MTTPFKICCMQDVSEAEMAIAAGALAIGLVGDMPNGPGPISDAGIREITAHVRARHGDKIWTTLLTSRTTAEGIADHIAYTGVNTVQIVDAPESGAYEKIRARLPAVRIMQVIHVEDEGAVDQALAAEGADVILLDSGKPSAAVRTLGGTGDVHDWSVSKRIVDSVGKPVFLAGGLNPENVAGAIKAVNPFGVDICSGLRDGNSRLIGAKLNAFAQALR